MIIKNISASVPDIRNHGSKAIDYLYSETNAETKSYCFRFRCATRAKTESDQPKDSYLLRTEFEIVRLSAHHCFSKDANLGFSSRACADTFLRGSLCTATYPVLSNSRHAPLSLLLAATDNNANGRKSEGSMRLDTNSRLSAFLSAALYR